MRIRFVQAIVFSFVLFGQSLYLFANPDIKYFETSQIVQRLTWQDEEDVLKYNITVEKKDDNKNTFKEIVNDGTNEPYYDLNLQPGEYRYKIVVYDLLGRVQPTSKWAKLTVLPTRKPQISSWSPLVIDSGDLDGLKITLSGSNFMANSKYKLKTSAGEELQILNADVNDLGDTAEIILSKADMKDSLRLAGGNVLNITVENPGSIESNLGTILIKDSSADIKSRTDKFIFTQGYMPFFNMYGSISPYFKNSSYPIGLGARFGTLPITKTFGQFGFDLLGSWCYLHSDSAYANYLGLQIFFSYQKELFPKRFFLNMRLGAGFSSLVGVHFDKTFFENQTEDENAAPDSPDNTENIATPNAAVGISFKYFLHENFFLEAGAQYMFLFDNDKTMFLQPAFMFGMSF